MTHTLQTIFAGAKKITVAEINNRNFVRYGARYEGFITPATSQESISAGSTAVPCVLPLSLVMLARVPPFFRVSGSLGSSHSMVGPAGQMEPCSKLLMSPDRTCSGNEPTAASVTTRTAGVRSPPNCPEVHIRNPSPGISVCTQTCTNADLLLFCYEKDSRNFCFITISQIL